MLTASRWVGELDINGLVEIIYLSWFVNCIVPAKLGDAYRSYLLKRNSNVAFSSTIGTILVGTRGRPAGALRLAGGFVHSRWQAVFRE